MESQKENKYYVYGLVDPINRTPFYIGKGCGNRAYSHLKSEKTNINKVKTINNIRMLGFEPAVYFIAENLSEKDSYDIEYAIIKNAKFFGCNLVNKSGLRMPPNRKGCKLSEETKKKIGDSSRGKKRKPMSEETRRKISLHNQGKEGPNKVHISDIETFKKLYIEHNFTKIQMCEYYNIGMASINRILLENNILKTKSNFGAYSKRRSVSKL